MNILRVKIVAATAIFLIAIAFSFALGLGYNVKGNALDGAEWVARRFVHHFFTHVEIWNSVSVPKIRIDILEKNYNKIMTQRSEALRTKVMNVGNEGFIRANIHFGGEKIPVKLRLKGDSMDHVEEARKFSLRIKTRKGAAIFGLKRFSVQRPSARNFQMEPLFFWHLRREGVIAPRYFFIKVDLNVTPDFQEAKRIFRKKFFSPGNLIPMGVMAVEEHFRKELLESNGRREGVMFKFDESYLITAWQNNNHVSGIFDSRNSAPIRPFDSDKVFNNEVMAADAVYGISLLRGFFSGTLNASDVFDVEKLGKYLAVSSLWDNVHGQSWDDLRFYLNPITRKIELIGWDANITLSTSVEITQDFTLECLSDPIAREAYTRHLRRISKEVLEGGLLKEIAAKDRELFHQLKWEHQELLRLDIDLLRSRATAFSNMSVSETTGKDSWLLAKPPTLLHAYLIANNGENYLELHNLHPRTVLIEEIWVTSDDPDGKKFPDLALSTFDLPLRLAPLNVEDPRYGGKNLPRKIPTANLPRLDLPEELGVGGIVFEGMARLDGHSEEVRFRSTRYAPVPKRLSMERSSPEKLLNQWPFLSYEPSQATIRVAPGSWTVDGPLTVPHGVTLSVPAGVTLLFSERARITAYGPLRFEGTREKKVILKSMNDDAGKTWGGIAVIGASQPSLLSNVEVRGVRLDEENERRLTGAVTFYESDVTIRDSRFIELEAEDSLNIIHGKFELSNVAFDGAPSDAIDLDFSQGVIRGGHFTNIGGDGIDVGGSEVEVNAVVLKGIGDKAVSAGERSRVTGSDFQIEDVGMGIVSKDFSQVVVEDVRILNARVFGVAAYTKKTTFGPSLLEVSRFSFEGSGRRAAAHKKSRVFIDGEPITSEMLNVRKLYDTAGK